MNKLFDNGGIKQVFSAINGESDVKINEKKYVRYLNDEEFIIHITMISE